MIEKSIFKDGANKNLTHPQKKKGISLIVLVITIIVMIILAGTIILSLNNSGIMNKAQDAVDATNLNEVKNLANVAWAEAYMNGARTEAELSAAVKQALTKNNITEDKYKGYTIIVTASGVDFGTKALNPSGVIPEGGVYYVGVTSKEVGTYTGATATYTAGDNFPTTVTTGDVYVYGDYEYRYNQGGWNWTTDNTQNGWGVRVIDTEKTTYGLILETINNKYIISLSDTFFECYSLTELPDGFTIPKGVINISNMFYYCANLQQLPNSFVIPSGVRDMSSTFACCYSLTKLPDDFTIPNGVTDISNLFWDTAITELPDGFTIPNSVTDMASMFEGTSITKLPDSFAIPNGVTNVSDMFSACPNLTELPEGFTIPSSVKYMGLMFFGCSSLTGTITINANPTDYIECFSYTVKPIVLTGSSTMLEEIAATSENGNVTVE